MKRKIFFISFSIMFLGTAIFCVLSKQPFIFLPINYSIGSFFELSLLIAILCFLLVFIPLPFVSFLTPDSRNEAYFVIGSFIILQLVTLITGYTESSLTRGVKADILYYYKGVGNSHIYLIMGNLTCLIAASLYAKEQTKKKKEKAEIKLDLGNSN